MGATIPDASAVADIKADTTSAYTNINANASGSTVGIATSSETTVDTKMPYRYMGGSGLLVSALALGSWNVYTDTFGVDQVYAIATRAFAHGVNFFDNAEGYGAGMAETVLGQVVQRGIKNGVWSREDLVLTTKIFLGTKPGPNNLGLSRKHIVEGTRASLKRMQVEYVDVLFCHRSEPYTPVEEIVRAMNVCINKGWAFYWGTSDWSSYDIIQACEIADRLGLIRPIIDQAKYSIFDRYTVEHDYEVLYQKYDYGLSIFSPMSVGILTGRYADGVKPGTRLSHPLYNIMIPDLEQRIEKAKTLQKFAEGELNCTLPQLALAWAVSNTRVSNVLVGASSVKQVDENMKALQVVEKLTAEVRARIDAIIEYTPGLPVQDSFPLLRSKYLVTKDTKTPVQGRVGLSRIHSNNEKAKAKTKEDMAIMRVTMTTKLTAMAVVTLLLLSSALAMIDYEQIWKDYNHIPTPCESSSCVSGGCLYENCHQPVSCSGGMCFFRNCKEAVCEGGVCVFDKTAQGKCPGGACKFQNMATTLTEGYCTGGACRLDDQAHPTNFAATLSE